MQARAPLSGSPSTSATRDHNWRAARNFAIVMNWSSSATRRKLIWRSASGDTDTGIDQQPHIAHAGGHRPGQLPRRIGAAVVKSRAVDGDRPHSGPGDQTGGECHHILDGGSVASAHRCGQRVGTQVYRHRRAGGIVRAGHQCQHRVGRGRPVRPGVEQNRHQIQIDALEKAVDIARPQPRFRRPAAPARSPRRRARPARRHCRRPRRRRSRGPGRTRPPSTRRRRRGCVTAADERPDARQRRFGQCVQRGVERADRKPLVGRRVEQALRLGAELGRFPTAALGQHTGNRGAPAGALLLHLY